MSKRVRIWFALVAALIGMAWFSVRACGLRGTFSYRLDKLELTPDRRVVATLSLHYEGIPWIHRDAWADVNSLPWTTVGFPARLGVSGIPEEWRSTEDVIIPSLYVPPEFLRIRPGDSLSKEFDLTASFSDRIRDRSIPEMILRIDGPLMVSMRNPDLFSTPVVKLCNVIDKYTGLSLWRWIVGMPSRGGYWAQLTTNPRVLSEP